MKTPIKAKISISMTPIPIIEVSRRFKLSFLKRTQLEVTLHSASSADKPTFQAAGLPRRDLLVSLDD
jgi:hypothetical protein